ncbi:MFS general substrate transporter [Athelia psychrophila]|uniref:MFS general substrate transporter n=1 Tax=Athelia psychrophila TaxID=1759441 RepID=A0A166NBB8_9AGAM|nr:MFS general substrate transporter [Fibularhizoctonia sp. CBS 109695]
MSFPEHGEGMVRFEDGSDSKDTAVADASQPGNYPGEGSPQNPYVVDWELGEVANPYNWTKRRKWIITAQLALSTFTVSFGSSSYSGGLAYTERDFHISEEVAVLGVSLYVLGFGLGPLFFAPLSEMFGRRTVFLSTYSLYTLLHLGGALGQNTATLLTCRLLSGIFGSSPLTNAGGTLADIWNARERGVATAIYATAPFLGPVVGPIVGGFVAERKSLGWHFNFWVMMILSATTLILGFLLTPETYAPVLLRRRARKLGKASDGAQHYISVLDLTRSKSISQLWRTNLSRPFVFLFTEPIVTLLAIYISLAYAILYSLFSAFPIVFQEHRHFTPGQGGLAFLGIGLGIVAGASLTPIQNRIYWRAIDNSDNGRAPPEARLHLAMVGGVLLPVSLFWFAWTSQPSIHWIVPVLAGVPFGIAVAQILQSLTAYLMDAYAIYSASAIAATVVLRSLLAMAFPLFSPSLFATVGDQWASTLFAFLALVCTPMPVLFWRYGKYIRSKSNWAYKETDPPDMRSGFSSRPDTMVEPGPTQGAEKV